MATQIQSLLEVRDQLIERFRNVEDPRVQGRCRHRLIDVVMLAFCATLCGSRSFRDMEFFGNLRLNWLRRFLELPSGIPSHDTIERVIGMIEPRTLETMLRNWAAELRQRLGLGPSPERVMIDGKSLKGNDKSFNQDHRPLHLLNVYEGDHSIVLAQTKASGAGISELRAAMECIEDLHLKGTLVTADAALASEEFTKRIVDKQGDYLIPIKKNQMKLYGIFEQADFDSGPAFITIDMAHGRQERRSCRLLEDGVAVNLAQLLRPEIKTIFRITRERRQKDKRYMVIDPETSKRVPNQNTWKDHKESVFYISSRELTAEQCLEHARSHWRVENELHWSLDIDFGEDASRIQNKVLARNMSFLRKMAFNTQNLTPLPPLPAGLEHKKFSRQTRIRGAALDQDYLEKLLACFACPQPAPPI